MNQFTNKTLIELLKVFKYNSSLNLSIRIFIKLFKLLYVYSSEKIIKFGKFNFVYLKMMIIYINIIIYCINIRLFFHDIG